MPGIPELSPTEFADRWPDYARGDGVVLLDVREHDELAVAAVAGALHIPMREVPGAARRARLQTTARRDVPLRRSQPQGSGVPARAMGSRTVFNLKGGIDAWSTQLDSQVPRY